MFPILLIEDNSHNADHIKLILGELGFFKEELFVWKENYAAARREIVKGVYPLVIVDFGLPAGGDEEGLLIDGESRGLDLIGRVGEWNRDVVFAAYSKPDRIQKHTKALLSHVVSNVLVKGTTEVDFINDVAGLCGLVRERFNYEQDFDIQGLLRQAFDETNELSKFEIHWELCIRRLFRDVRGVGMSFQKLKGGKSGAGVVSVHFDDQQRRPIILKLDRYERLLDESRRCNEHALPYLSRFAMTRDEDLSQAGEFGILAYRLAGTSSFPTSLGSELAKSSFDRELVRNAIADHFISNCKHWFPGFVLKYDDICAPFRRHLFAVNESSSIATDEVTLDLDLRKRWAELSGARAFTVAAEVLGVEIETVVATIEGALHIDRFEVYCRFNGRVHGDLNVHNLIWDDGKLWLIDFAKASDAMPATTDFVKLEASVKFDIACSDESDLSAFAAKALEVEEVLCASLLVDEQGDRQLEEFGNRLGVLSSLREAAHKLCSGEDLDQQKRAYLSSLFFVTSKQVFYLLKDIQAGEDKERQLVHAIISAYRLAVFMGN